MRALFATGQKDRTTQWQEVEAPSLIAETDALVRPLAVALCDLDRLIIEGRSPFPGSFMLGHEFTGEVLAIGSEVTGLNVGDVVLASFQPSCGACPRCSARHSSVCSSVANGSMYGIGASGGDWGGALADLIRVPWADANLFKLPEQVDPVAIASGADNLADGLRGVEEPLLRRPAASVLVAGGGSIPLYAVLCARFLGAGTISVASADPFVLATAEQLGAECLPIERWPKRFRSHDVTVDCTNDEQGLSAILRSTEPYGECSSSSIFFGGPTPIPLFELNMRGIHFHTGRVNSAAVVPRVLELVEAGLDPGAIDPVFATFADLEEAAAAEPFSRKLIVSNA
ncbi:MAG: alcohol dehydrogenase catalytic domain-containing protein [Pseudomonadota bacterium]